MFLFEYPLCRTCECVCVCACAHVCVRDRTIEWWSECETLIHGFRGHRTKTMDKRMSDRYTYTNYYTYIVWHSSPWSAYREYYQHTLKPLFMAEVQTTELTLFDRQSILIGNATIVLGLWMALICSPRKLENYRLQKHHVPSYCHFVRCIQLV